MRCPMPSRELLERARMFEERAERATDPISRKHYREMTRMTRRYQSSRWSCGAQDGALSLFRSVLLCRYPANR